MPTLMDLSGRKFGRLTAVRLLPKDGQKRKWECLCECNNIVCVATDKLVRQSTVSCGCLKRERIGSLRRSHGMTAKPEYLVWAAMIQRCHNEKSRGYKNYGSRGIHVCDRWRGKNGFATFIKDMGLRPTPKHTIERVKNHLGYSPDNCEWRTKHIQSRNKRNNRIISYRGRTMCVTDWEAELFGGRRIILNRLDRYGWTIDRAMRTPIGAQADLANGERQWKHKLTENDVREIRASAEGNVVLARKYGVTRATLRKARLGLSWSHIR